MVDYCHRLSDTKPVWQQKPLRLSVRGFTLLEVMVVLVLAALLLTTVSPRFFGVVTTAEVRGAARQLAAGLRYARSRSIVSKQEVAMVLDVDRHQYHIQGQQQVQRLPEQIELTLVTARSEISDTTRGSIRFFPDGSSTGGRITVANEKYTYIVNVDWLSGRVSIVE